MKKFALISILFVTNLTAWAEPQTVTLDVPTMNCGMCPITVKKSLTKVEGVSDAKVSYKTKQAIVTFDNDETDTAALIKATTNAGYPSTINEQN